MILQIMNITQQCLKRFKGHLRQFIIDDKGVVLILSWGEYMIYLIRFTRIFSLHVHVKFIMSDATDTKEE